MQVDPRRWFAGLLQQLMRQAGVPSGRVLAESTTLNNPRRADLFALVTKVNLVPRELSRSAVSRLLNAEQQGVPDWDTVAMFVVACVGWAAGHGRLLARQPPLQALPDLVREWQRRHEDLADMLAQSAATAESEIIPVRVGSVPMRADQFQSRGVDLDVDAALRGGRAVVLTQVLSGGGGVGKTQVAADYARLVWPDPRVRLAVWVSAGSRDQLISTYARAAGELMALDDQAHSDPEVAAARLMEWLASTRDRWLIVLDDVQRLDDIRGLWPPTTDNGQVIVTTRRRDSALSRDGRAVIPVGVFTAEQSRTCLAAKFAILSPEALSEAAELAEDLGHLPIALAQAAAYILDRGLTCRDYRTRFADRRRTLDTLFPEPAQLPDDHAKSVAATWALSVELADAQAPINLATPLLRMASLLDPAGIPLTVFTSPPAVHAVGLVAGREITAEDITDTLCGLHHLNLLDCDRDSSARSIRIHALVQRATRETILQSERADLARIVADALLAVWPAVERDTDLAQVHRANAETLRATTGNALWNPDTHSVLFRTGKSLGESGAVRRAIEYLRDLHSLIDHHLNPDHPDTLTTRGNLARWQGEAGAQVGAVRALEHLLTDCLRILGPDHPDTLIVRDNLATWRAEAGDPAGAARALEHLLTDQLRIHGADHPDTLTTRGNLASCRARAGDPTGAASAFEHLLTDQLRIHGADHPDTLTTRSNLAFWQGEAGDPVGAASAFEHLLTDYLRILGPDHLDTLATRNSLAWWLGEAGDPVRAAQAAEHLLTDYLRILGPDHPRTLAARGNLASWLGDAGDPVGAACAFEHLLTDYLRILGPDHPDTLATRSNHASWLGKAGDPASATHAFEHLLIDQLRVLGPDHPHILATCRNIARWRKSRQSTGD